MNKSKDPKREKNAKLDLLSLISKNKNIFHYSPFKGNDILQVIYTTNNLIMLLRNGTCISWGSNRATLGRRCTDSNSDAYLPKEIKFSIRIVDIVCGRNHCLARGSNFKVYSWGENTYGQLGLSGFPMSIGSEKDEPTDIQTFQNIKIKQIFASGNSSFAITEGGNNLYGWGDNENGQLGLNFERSQKVQVPKLIDLTEKFLSEVVVIQNKNGKKSFLAELHRPASNISQAMIFFNNKHLHYKELELKAEKEKLDLQEEQIKKRRGIFNANSNAQDIELLLKEINILILFYSNKLNNFNKRALEDKIVRNKEIIKSYQVQINYQKEKEDMTNKQIKSLEQSQNKLDLERLKNRTMGDESMFNQKKVDLQTKKKNIFKIEKLIENVNSGLHENKHNTLTEHMHIMDQLKKMESKMIRFGDYINIFENVKLEAKRIIDKKLEKETIKDLKGIMEKISIDQSTLTNNLIRNYDSLNPDSEFLSESIIKSGDNLLELEDKLEEYNIDKNNTYGKKMVSMMKSNVLMAKMNNILLDKISSFAKLHYTKSFERFFASDQIDYAAPDVMKKIQAQKHKMLQEEERRKKEEEENEFDEIEQAPKTEVYDEEEYQSSD